MDQSSVTARDPRPPRPSGRISRHCGVQYALPQPCVAPARVRCVRGAGNRGSGGQRDGWGNGSVWTEPGVQDLDPAPRLNASGEHRVIVLRFAGEEYYLFDRQGEIVLTYCDRSSSAFTQIMAGFVTAALRAGAPAMLRTANTTIRSAAISPRQQVQTTIVTEVTLNAVTVDDKRAWLAGHARTVRRLDRYR